MDPANEQEEMVEIDLREMINIFLERWYIIVGLTVIAGIAAGIFSFMQDPIYESSTQVLVEEQDPAMEGDSFFPMALDSGSENMANRLHIISSPLVLDKARELLLEEGNEEYATYLEEKREKIVQVNNQGDTDIIEIKVTARTPQEAKALASSIAFAYQNYREDRAQEQSRRVVSFLEEQVDQAEAETKRAEEEVRDYQKQEGVISLNDEASKLNDQLTELETRRVTADIKIQEQEMRLEQVNENLTELKDQLPEESTIVTESLVENLREQLSELEAERIDYLNRGLAESSPEIESLDRRINNLEQSIREYTREVTARPEGENEGLDYYNQLLAERTSLEAEIEGRKNEINILNQKISEYDEELGRLSDKGFQMARLERDVEITRNTYTMLSEELERSKISVEREMSDVRIIDEAQLPEAPISPRTLLNVFIACFLGIFAGTGLIFMLEYLDNTVKEKDELEHLTELPVLGVIPDIEKIDHKHSHYYGSDEN